MGRIFRIDIGTCFSMLVTLFDVAKGDVRSPLGASVTLVEAALNGSCTRLSYQIFMRG